MKTYNNFITKDNKWLFNDFMIQLVLTNDGLYKMENAMLSGTCLIVNQKVYRASQYIIFENWFEFFLFFNKNRKLVKQIVQSMIFDLDDYDCCADGFICFINKTPKEYFNRQTALWTPFNNDVRKAIKSCFEQK